MIEIFRLVIEIFRSVDNPRLFAFTRGGPPVDGSWVHFAFYSVGDYWVALPPRDKLENLLTDETTAYVEYTIGGHLVGVYRG